MNDFLYKIENKWFTETITEIQYVLYIRLPFSYALQFTRTYDSKRSHNYIGLWLYTNGSKIFKLYKTI